MRFPDCEPSVLLQTKVHPPIRPAGLLDRPQLLERTAGLLAARLTLVQAPAGYGKSCLMLQWFQALGSEHVRTAWLSLDAADRDPFTFLAYLVAALDVAGHRVDESVRSLLAGERYVSTNVITTQLVNSFVGAAAPTLLFIDDVHHLGSTPAGACLRALIESAPPQLHVVLAARERVDFPVARLRALGQLMELGISELRFDKAEIAAFLAGAGHSGLAGSTIDSIASRTEGWIAGLKLASMALNQESGAAGVLGKFSGTRCEVMDFFAEDVLACQPADLQEFLLKTSVLARLCPEVCDAVTGLGSARQYLDRIERSGLFLIALDTERTWYRYHRLFAEFLRRSLADQAPAEQSTLHCRASDWLLEQGFYIEALEQATQGRDPVRAARILDCRCDAMAVAGQDLLILRFAAQIPKHIQASYPRIMLAVAWERIIEWRFDEARELLAASRARFEELRLLGGMQQRELRELEQLLLHREMMLAQFQDDMPKTERLCATLIREYADAHPYLKASFYTSLINSRREQHKLDDIERLDAIARQHLQRTATPNLFPHEAVIGASWFIAGNSSAAIQCLEAGLDGTLRVAAASSAVGAITALPLAEIYYERNDLVRAAELVDTYLGAGARVGYVDQLVSGWLTRARLVRLQIGTTAALRELDEAAGLAAQHGFERLRLWVDAERIKLLLRAAQPEEAARVAHHMGLLRSPAAVMPGANVTSRDEARALAWFRLAQAQNRIAEASKVAKQWRTHFVNARAVRNVVRWEVLIAGLMCIDGQPHIGRRVLRQAMVCATSGRFMRTFLDEGALIGTLLLEQVPANKQAGRHGDDATDLFAMELATHFEREIGRPAGVARDLDADALRLGGAVNSKEMEILTLVGSGMLNREIAARLGMTEGSVKWYLQQIYNKIGVRRRAQAVDRARQFGLIA